MKTCSYLLLFDKINTTLINKKIFKMNNVLPHFLIFVKHLINIIESNELAFMVVLFSRFLSWAFIHAPNDYYNKWKRHIFACISTCALGILKTCLLMKHILIKSLSIL